MHLLELAAVFLLTVVVLVPLFQRLTHPEPSSVVRVTRGPVASTVATRFHLFDVVARVIDEHQFVIHRDILHRVGNFPRHRQNVFLLVINRNNDR